MARSPHILYLLDDLGSGGAQRQAVETAAHLASQDVIQATFLTYHEDDFFGSRLDAAGISRRCIPKRVGLDPIFARRLRVAISSESPNLVHAFMRGPSFWAGQALRGGWRRSKTALVTSERNSFVGLPHSQAFALRRAFRRADAVTANGALVAAEIPDRFRVQPVKVHYIPNGIDLAAWDESAREQTPLSFAPDRFHIGLVGRLVRQKNHLLLLRALHRVVPAMRSDWKVWFIGAEGGAHGCEQAVRTEVKTLGLTDLVEIVGPQAGIAPVMKALDLLVLSSDYEGFPNVVLEAMASSTPVIATDVGDMANLMGENVGGFVVPRGDEAALPEALVRMASLTSAERDAIGSAGRRRVEDRFPMEAIAAQYLELYRRVLAGRA